MISSIITNNPFVKFLKNATNPEGHQEKTVARQTAQDVVEISDAARKHLDGVRNLKAEGPEAVGETTQETREILTKNQGLTLGADPAFD